MPPFKRYTNIELLSGGEKTVAAVALIFSILSFMCPPFAIVDEIDAALDSGNVQVLSKFMRHAVTHPLIVISLKEKMYAKADFLIGVYKDLARHGSSGLVTVDLRPYPEVPVVEVPQEEHEGTVTSRKSKSRDDPVRRLSMGA
jgi:structural maintenance of chromosome 1